MADQMMTSSMTSRDL